MVAAITATTSPTCTSGFKDDFLGLGCIHSQTVVVRGCCANVAGTKDLWPYLLLVNAGPAVVSLLFMPCLPDSPRYLAITRNQRHEAIKGPSTHVHGLSSAYRLLI